MAADNDLEPFSFQDLDEIAAVQVGDAVARVVQVDWAPGKADRPEGWDDKDYKSTVRMVAADGGWQVVEDLGELDSSRPEALSDFVKWAVGEYPAEHTALILWDHGEAVSGFALDFSSWSGYMTVHELGQSLGEAVAGSVPGGRLDIIGFDACLMASYEVASALAGAAHFLVASEEWIDYQGWDYGSLSILADGAAGGRGDAGEGREGGSGDAGEGREGGSGDAGEGRGGGDVDGLTLAQEFAQRYAESCEVMGLSECTVSVVALDAIPALDDAVAGFAGAAAALADVQPTAIADARRGAESYDAEVFEMGAGHLADLGHFVSLAVSAVAAGDGPEEAEAVAAAGQELLNALDGAVRFSSNGPDHELSTGLSVYFPMLQEWYDGEMYDTASAGASWPDFLAAFYGAVGPGVMGPFFASGPTGATVDEGENGWSVAAKFETGAGALAVSASVYGGFYDEYWEAYDLFAAGPADLDEAADGLSGLADGLFPLLGQPEDETYAFAVFEPLADGGLRLSFPIDYWDESAGMWFAATWCATLEADYETLAAAEFRYGLPGEEEAAFQPGPGDIFIPLVYEWSLDDLVFEWFEMDAELAADEAITVTLMPPEAGDVLWFALAAWDEFGTGDFSGAEVTF